MLWNCQAKQKGHARGPKARDSQTKTVRHPSKDQEQLDSNTVDRQERHLHAD